MGQPLLLGLQFLQLPGLQGGRLQTVELRLVIVAFRFAAADSFFQILRFRFQLPQGLPRGPAGGKGFRIARVQVQHAQLEGRIGQPEGLMLGVDIHQMGGNGSQHGERHGRIV